MRIVNVVITEVKYIMPAADVPHGLPGSRPSTENVFERTVLETKESKLQHEGSDETVIGHIGIAKDACDFVRIVLDEHNDRGRKVDDLCARHAHAIDAGIDALNLYNGVKNRLESATWLQRLWWVFTGIPVED